MKSTPETLPRRPYRYGTNSIPRVLVFLSCALALFVILPHAARAIHINTGHISGRLLNGSRNNAPIANQSVTLQMAQDSNERDLITLTTDAHGRYSFSALESDSSVEYAIYTLYQGAQYVSNLIDLSKNADQQVNLTVYDATTSTSSLAVVQAVILIDKPNAQTGLYSVSETFAFENLGLTTYVGSLDTSKGKLNALTFSLPSNARFLSLADSFNGYKSKQVAEGFASNAAVPPGTSSFSFSFQVPYTGTAAQFAYQAIYPTVSLSLLTPLDIDTTPSGLTAKGPSTTQNGTYQLFQTQMLGASKSVSAQLEGLPPLAKAAPSQTPTTVNTNLLWLVMLLIVLLALAGIGGYLYNTRRARSVSKKKSSQRVRTAPEPTSRPKPAASKNDLLQEMLDLDKAHDAGKVKDAAYQEQRARLKRHLRVLMDEQPEAAGKAGKSSGGRKK